MVRKIVKINEEKCNGCGLCINACHEGALVLENGKAKLVSDAYCDGLGNCLPECPTGAIEIIEREAEAFDEAAVNKRLGEMGLPPVQNGQDPDQGGHGAGNQESPASHSHAFHSASGCPGSRMRFISRNNDPDTTGNNSTPHTATGSPCSGADTKPESQLRQWPCQIKLVSPNAPYFHNAHLLVAADCTAYAYASIHQEFMKGRITIIGCPKLDDTDYSEKLAAILANNNIQSITVLRMEVPCCGGLVQAVRDAMLTSGRIIPWNVVTISIDGNIINQ
ncbi:MAG TPA: 4Fe-4S binding protein [Clostridiales bacterium]|nr:4Fe-4S binding protein [Clostridiales bacterium]HOL92105.1 4Fe-4S binding protein [Clostridiales bacterium]